MSSDYRAPTADELETLLTRDHSPNGGILFGLEGYTIEIQARAMEIFSGSMPWRHAVRISGMARGAVSESLDLISGAFAKLSIPPSPVSILVNLVPPDLLKEGTSLDLPLAIIILQAAGILPPLPEHLQGDFLLLGEVGIHGEVRRVPGALSLAFCARPGQHLIVPAGNEKECALILAKPGHENCKIYPITLLDDLLGFFRGRRALDHVLKQGPIQFEDVIPRAVDFGVIRGQERAKEAAWICAAGGHNLLLIGPPGEGKSLLASALPGIRTTSSRRPGRSPGRLPNGVPNRRKFREGRRSPHGRDRGGVGKSLRGDDGSAIMFTSLLTRRSRSPWPGGVAAATSDWSSR